MSFRSREHAMAVIHLITDKDAFLAKFALLRSLEAHDLGQVNSLLDDLLDVTRDQALIANARIQELLRERFGEV